MKILLVLALVLAAASRSVADGGVVLAKQTVNGLAITVFASPVPLRAGPADVSVLVQDAGGRAVLDAEVGLGWTSSGPATEADWLPPCCSMSTALGQVPATRAHSQNKLLYGAMLPVRNAGPGEIAVTVRSPRGDADLSVPVTAAPPQPPVLTYWPLMAFPPVAVGLFALHQRLTRRNRKGWDGTNGVPAGPGRR